MFSKDTFCSLPWSSILIGSSGDCKACCFTPAVTVGKVEPSPNILTHEITDMMNSQIHKEIRLAQSRNERHSACRMCWDHEDAAAKGKIDGDNSPSTRQAKTFHRLVDMTGVINMEEAQSLLLEDGSLENPKAISLDLRFSNLCNKKCVMCGPHESSLWYEDFTKIYGKTDFGYRGKVYNIYQENGVYKSDAPVWHDSPIWWAKFEKIKYEVRHIYLTGGEPFLVKGHETLLDNLIEADCAKDIELEYDTNLSVINDRILNKLSHFKNVVFSVSLDDVGQQYELIRFPGGFEDLIENIQTVMSKGIKIRWVSTCMGIHSVFAPLRMYDFFSKNPIYNQDGKPMPLGIRFLKFPEHFNLAHLPKDLKLKIMGVYLKADFDPEWKKHILGYLADNMNVSEELSTSKLREHIKFMDDLDKLRGTDWRTTLPDVADLLKDYL